MKATGTFEVSLEPAPTKTEFSESASFADMTFNKTFTGQLNATSVGEMLSVRLPASGSAGYVAIEQVTGQLLGKKGSFVLQHYGLMTADSSHLTLEVSPNSGTDELTGLAGSMTITIEDGKHFYDLDYQLA